MRACRTKKTGSHSLSALILLALAADPGTGVRNFPLPANAVQPIERIPLCRSGADPKSRLAWTGGQQRLFDSGGQSPLHR